MVCLKALFICENLKKLITNKEIMQGYVHSIFKNACNIETEHEFVTLLAPGKGMSPMSISTDNGGAIDFIKLDISKNMRFCFNDENIFCKEKNFSIALASAKSWFPGVDSGTSNCLEKEVLLNIEKMGAGLRSHGKHNGISPLISMLKEEMPELDLQAIQTHSPDKNTEFIKDSFLNFIETVLKGDCKNIDRAARKVIGFGPGLTPAMDDFICGIMISFIYFGAYYNLNLSRVYKFNENLINKSLNKTTRVSAEMLKHSAKGCVNQAVRELLQTILNQKTEEAINSALIKVTKIGETSGSDTALGIYTGCKIMTNIKYRGEWLNEAMC
jgi:hypothetical protein